MEVNTRDTTGQAAGHTSLSADMDSSAVTAAAVNIFSNKFSASSLFGGVLEKCREQDECVVFQQSLQCRGQNSPTLNTYK